MRAVRGREQSTLNPHDAAALGVLGAGQGYRGSARPGNNGMIDDDKRP
jgi:hypothetical protein